MVAVTLPVVKVCTTVKLPAHDVVASNVPKEVTPASVVILGCIAVLVSLESKAVRTPDKEVVAFILEAVKVPVEDVMSVADKLP